MKTGIRTMLTGLLGALLASSAQGQEKIRPAVQSTDRARPAARERDAGGVHRMVIYNGPNRSVRYFGDPGSVGESASLRDLERAENEVSYSDNLLALRQQYISDERGLEARRRVVQERLYGLSINSGSAAFYNGVNYPTYPTGFYGYPFYWGGGYGYGGNTYGLSSSSQVNESLANGVGDEGRIKDALAHTIATQATPEYAVAAARGYDTALARAAESPNIRTALGMSNRGGVAPVGFDQPRKAVLTLKGGDKVEGTLVREDADWFVIDTGTDEVSVRKSDVVRVSKAKAK